VIAALRRLRLTGAEIALCLNMALSTVSAVLQRIGLGKLSRLEPPEPPNRYQRRRPGELLHIDVLDREAAPHVNELQRPVDVRPAQRPQLAEPQPGEGGDGEDGGVLLGLGVPGQPRHLGRGEHREIARAPLRLPLGTSDRDDRELVHALSAPISAV
jgi:hypothetical protein